MFASTKTDTVLWFIPVGLDTSHQQTGLDRQLLTLPASPPMPLVLGEMHSHLGFPAQTFRLLAL